MKIYAFAILFCCTSLTANVDLTLLNLEAQESSENSLALQEDLEDLLSLNECLADNLPIQECHINNLPANECIDQRIEFESFPPTVVVIHGFMSSFRSMHRIGYNLRCSGAETYLWNYPSRRRTLRQHACYLTILLNEIASRKPGCPIYFVAHSTGGVILRAALSLPSCPNEAKIGRAVLIAPPNQGSVFARRMGKFGPIRVLMGKKSGRELICYSECDIQALGTFPPSMDILVFAGRKSPWDSLFCEPNDGFVTIEETRLETAHRHLIFNLTHSQLIQHSHILARISRFIISGCPQKIAVEKACLP